MSHRNHCHEFAHENYVSDNLWSLYDQWDAGQYGYPITHAENERIDMLAFYGIPYILVWELERKLNYWPEHDKNESNA